MEVLFDEGGGALVAAGVAEGLADFLGVLMVAGVLAEGGEGLAKLVGGGLAVGAGGADEAAGADGGDLLAVKVLFEMVGDDDLGDAVVEAFVNAVHATVGDEVIGTLEDIELRDIVLDDEVGGDGAEVVEVGGAAGGEDELGGVVGEGGE